MGIAHLGRKHWRYGRHGAKREIQKATMRLMKKGKMLSEKRMVLEHKLRSHSLDWLFRFMGRYNLIASPQL